MTILLLSILLLATPEPAAPPPPKPDPQATVREILRLTDQQAGEVLPILETLEAERTKRREARRASLRALRQDLDAGAPDDTIEAQVRAFEKAEAEHQERVKGLLRKAEKPLSVPQRARLLLLLERSAETGRDRPRPLRRPRPAPAVPPS